MISKIQKTGLHHYNALGEKVDGINPKMSVSNPRFLSCLWGDCSGLVGDCSGLRGDCSGVWGYCTGVSGDLDLCEITHDLRKHGVKLEYLIFKSEAEK